MFNVMDYIKKRMKELDLDNPTLLKRINALEDKVHDEKTYAQHFWETMNGVAGHELGYKQALYFEKALELPPETLVKMVGLPESREGMNTYLELKKKLYETRGRKRKC